MILIGNVWKEVPLDLLCLGASFFFVFILPFSVMVTHKVLVLGLQVRVLWGQQSAPLVQWIEQKSSKL